MSKDVTPQSLYAKTADLHHAAHAMTMFIIAWYISNHHFGSRKRIISLTL